MTVFQVVAAGTVPVAAKAERERLAARAMDLLRPVSGTKPDLGGDLLHGEFRHLDELPEFRRLFDAYRTKVKPTPPAPEPK